MARIALSLKTWEVASFSIKDWKRGERWGDEVSGDVGIEWTLLPSGGKRPWFLCPSCGRRCGILYAIRSRLLCRKCGKLSYESQSETSHYRALRKAQKIRARLGGSGNMAEPFPSRPRYMHRRTYQRLRFQYQAAEKQYMEPLIALLKKRTATGENRSATMIPAVEAGF